MQCVDPLTGEIKWSQKGFGPASPDEYSELSRNKVLEGKCWSTPSIHEGKIYLRSTTEAACVSFE